MSRNDHYLEDLAILVSSLKHNILVPFVQFKKREKYPWRGVTFSKDVQSCTNGTKRCKASHIFLQSFLRKRRPLT